MYKDVQTVPRLIKQERNVVVIAFCLICIYWIQANKQSISWWCLVYQLISLGRYGKCITLYRIPYVYKEPGLPGDVLLNYCQAHQNLCMINVI